MIGVVYEYKGPRVGRGRMSRVMKAALDAALTEHRREFFPRHFQASAPGRYGAPYRTEKGRRASAAFTARLGRMSPEQLVGFWQERRQHSRVRFFTKNMTPAQRDEYNRMNPLARQRLLDKVGQSTLGDIRSRYNVRAAEPVADPTGRLPLVHTGLMRARANSAPVTFHNPAHRRVMRIHGMPHYLTYDRPGGIRKVAAMQATTSGERSVFAKRADAVIDRYFKSR